MSLRTKILLVTVPAVFLLAGALSALLLVNLIEANLQNSRHLAELAIQQTKEMLLLRLEDASKSGASGPAAWRTAIATDPRLEAYLVNSVAQAPSLVEISVAGDDGRILVSSTRSIAGSPLRVRPSLYDLVALGPVDRIRKVLEHGQDYELRIPIGRLDDPRPIFNIQVLVSTALLRDLIGSGLRWIGVASVGALVVSLLFVSLMAGFVSRNLRRIEQDIDLIRKGEDVPAPGAHGPPAEFAAVQSKLSMLGAEVRDTARTAEDFRSRVSAVLERLEEGILLFDATGGLVLSGGAASRLLGEEPSGTHVLKTPLGAMIGEALRGGQSLPERLIDWPRDGRTVPLLASVDLLGSRALVRLRDPEGRRQLESNLGLLARLDAINRLTGGVAHEIKNPLNSIAARLALLESMTEDSEEAQEEIRVIGEEVMRLDRVVRTFLDFTRPVELAQAEFDFAELAGDVASLVKPDAGRRNVEVKFTARPERVPLWGDAELLRQALMNLAVNAVDAMPEGGTLSIEVDGEHAGDVRLVVADTGTGIPPAAREKIFQLYFTTKKNGSGIGLAMVYRAVQLHGGSIDVESELGRGTRFLIRLPELTKR